MSTVWAISMVKDEIDVIYATVTHMATQVDGIIVADNMSTDGTYEELERASRDVSVPLVILKDEEPGFLQSKKMTDLAKVARIVGAEWVVPFDADEIWYSPFGTIKEVLSGLEPQWLVATADLYDHVTSSEDDLSELNPVRRIGWRRREKGFLPKVACRYRDDLVIQQGNHGATYNGGSTNQDGLLVIRHFPYRSAEQMMRKARNGAAAYAATDLGEEVGAHWRGYGAILKNSGEEVFVEEVYKRWFYLNDPKTLEGVIYDPAPIY